MIMLKGSSQVLQCPKLWPITNWLINLSTGLPYGLFTQDCKTIPLSKTSAYTGVSLVTGLSCNLFEAINLRSDTTVYPNMAKQFPLQRYLLI